MSDNQMFVQDEPVIPITGSLLVLEPFSNFKHFCP